MEMRSISRVCPMQSCRLMPRRLHTMGLAAAAKPPRPAVSTTQRLQRELILFCVLGGGIAALHHGRRRGEPLPGQRRDLDAELHTVARQCGDHGGILRAVRRNSRGPGSPLPIAVEKAGRFHDVFDRAHDLFLGQVHLEQPGQNLLVKQQISRRLPGVGFHRPSGMLSPGWA